MQHHSDKQKDTMPVAPAVPETRTTTRKIGKTTFIISSSFNQEGKGDVVSKLARLIRDEAEKGA
ncbi:transposon-encoded TnpW family protein [Ruminococcaceae bacterium OttesenSCG-928-D13]|nr:transposon-encoded TnpW family protein [Ruminococcaceae bacterium OttesenSCG-928-D13]